MSRKRSKPAASHPQQHKLDHTRTSWTRKPQTQIVPNKKAEQRRMRCRRGNTDGAVLFMSRPCILPQAIAESQACRVS
ncbi:hypothetical protein DNH61_14045 [Paenibacillus sambharensis]|uniref:Uncharacterized protein n=1 Tax=Paenibacillus sambharensis TaxID=1803190 RepID=A0A2W1L8R3_9BACL|nr:hypothetical protein [Paenibacillus sambharensis]PZD95636.1 hypothetical protein DNH61_14045 [Paenibacillus sambharensis]